MAKNKSDTNNVTVSYDLKTKDKGNYEASNSATPEITSVYVSQPKELELGAEGAPVCKACDYLSCSCPTLDSGKNLTKIVQELTKKD